MATKYHNPKTGKTVEAKNRDEALEKMATRKPKTSSTEKKTSKADKATKEEKA